MKILIRLRGNEYLGYYVLEDTETVKEQEFEELPYKSGYYNETYYDEKEKILKQKYVEIQKTKEQLLEEEIEKIKRAIADGNPDLSELDTLRANSNRKKTDSVPNLSELENL
jgi:hypothetical protein